MFSRACTSSFGSLSKCKLLAGGARARVEKANPRRFWSSFRSSSPLTASSVSSSRRLKHEFKWAHLVGPTPNAELVAAYKNIDSAIAEMRTVANTQVKVPSIDWAYWEKEITSPGVVASIRKQYELLKFDRRISQEEIDKNNKFWDEQIAAEEKVAANLKHKLQAAKAKLAEDVAWRENCDAAHFEDYFRRMPGLKEQYLKDFWEGDYSLSDEDEKFVAWDPEPLLQALRTQPSVPETVWPSPIPQKQGNLDILELFKTLEKEDLANNAHIPGYKSPFTDVKLPPIRSPSEHKLLPLLAQRKAGAPVFGAPIPGQPEAELH